MIIPLLVDLKVLEALLEVLVGTILGGSLALEVLAVPERDQEVS
jgi:hypothetical protein